jgi:hypothetical protein
MLQSKALALVTAVTIGSMAAFFGACGDDDGDQESAADLTATFENFKRDLLATNDIGNAPDDVKDGLKDDCGELQDGVDSDDLDEFCDDLGAAIDDEDQADFEVAKGRFATVETAFRNEIADRAQDAVGDDDDDEPLEGGDPGDDDDNDGADDGDDGDVNPLD